MLQKLIALHLPHNTTELKSLYEMKQDSPCAAWVFPYRAFDFRAVGLSRNWKHQTMAFENKRFRGGVQQNKNGYTFICTCAWTYPVGPRESHLKWIIQYSSHLRQIGAFRPFKRDCAKLRDRRKNWIVSKRQTNRIYGSYSMIENPGLTFLYYQKA